MEMENATLIYIVIVLLAFLSNIRRFNKFFIMIKDCYCVEKTPPIYILTKKIIVDPLQHSPGLSPLSCRMCQRLKEKMATNSRRTCACGKRGEKQSRK